MNNEPLSPTRYLINLTAGAGAWIALNNPESEEQMGEVMGKLITNVIDEPMLCAIFAARNPGVLPKTLGDLEAGREALNDIKASVRDVLCRVLDREAARLKLHNTSKATREFLKNASAKHELGTVAEIAQKYNISKSEVRRRKADGTLESYIASLNPFTQAMQGVPFADNG